MAQKAQSAQFASGETSNEAGAEVLQQFRQGALGYAVDAFQRSALYLDVIRERGNIFLEHLLGGKPALLKFDHELLIDGRSLPHPCNYSLLHILPPAGTRVDETLRPFVVVDPRAGHGPGIGGFKPDSQIGVALRAGHPVYFITFAPDPVDGQTLGDVARAEAHFLEEVGRRHADAGKPVIIGNCQAGWAVACLAAVWPDRVGPIVLNGAPLSYWAGSAKQNPMRYSGGTLGGSWMAALSSDLAGDRFDGAYLVSNFENLNLGNTYWGKYYNLYANVDTERERFLEFERWWGGYFRMTGEEIQSIVENLFVGNRLARGEVVADGQHIDLRNITSPVVVFASWGDNITPPAQALNWVLDVWGTEKAIEAAGRTIVYLVHHTIGHLGIFVGGAIARKEHDQIVNTMDMIDALPPGLYEMVISDKDESERFADLEVGKYSVRFERRTMDDIRALDPDGREDEAVFSTVAQLSDINMKAYQTWLQPWVKLMGNRALGDTLRMLDPLRLQHLALSDLSPVAPWLRMVAQKAREQRKPVDADNPWLAWEKLGSEWLVEGLNAVGNARDEATTHLVTMAYGPAGLGAVLPPRESGEAAALKRASRDEAAARRLALSQVDKGGFGEAVCRILLVGLTRTGVYERRSFRLGKLLGQHHRDLASQGAMSAANARPVDWSKVFDEQALVVAFAGDEALAALPRMLPTQGEREQALALAAAVLMAEPQLSDPDAPAAQYVRTQLGVEPAKVLDLASTLVREVVPAEDLPAIATPATPATPAKRARATSGKKPPARSSGKAANGATNGAKNGVKAGATAKPAKTASRSSTTKSAKATKAGAAKPAASASGGRARKPASSVRAAARSE